MDEKCVQHHVSRYEQLASQRHGYERTWDEITEFVMPHRGDFNITRSAGQMRNRRLYDGTAIQSNEYLASLMHSGLTSGNNKWFSFRSRNKQLQQNYDITTWFEDVTNQIFNVLNSPISNFQSQNHELMLDLTGYGTACMYVDQRPGEPVRFKAIHLSEIFIAEDTHGIVDTVFRKFKFTARQAAQFWGHEALSESLKEILEDKPDTILEFLHCVCPNSDYDEESKMPSKLAFRSCYIELDTKHCLEDSGYHEMPYLVPRWAKLVGEVYGRSPTWNALTDIKLLNTVVKTFLISTEKSADPTLLLADDGVMLPLKTSPGGIIFGGLGADGSPRVQPLHTQADLGTTSKFIDSLQQAIRLSYHIDPQTMQPPDRETATSVNYRQQDRLRIIAPQINRVDTEYVSKLIARVYGIMSRSKQLPQMDPALANEVEKHGIEIVYNSQLVKSQRLGEIEAKQRLFQMYLPLVQADPTLLQLLNLHESMRQDADILGVPISVLVSEQELAQKQQAAQLAQQAEQLAQVAQTGSQAALNFAKAGQASRTPPVI